MNFYLQQGYGMMTLNNEFAEKFDNLGVILAPRALQKTSDVSTLEKHSRALRKRKVKILFDPQFYIPKTNMEKILKFPYYRDLAFETISFNKYAKDFCINVISYQIYKMYVDEIILPGRYINSISQEWYDMQEAFIDAAQEYISKYNTYLTLALGPDVIKSKDSFDGLVNRCINYPVNGFYVVLQSPGGKFLIDDQDYIYSLLDAFISFSLAGKDVILGYSNQQSLIYAAAGVDAVASGTFRNVRSFNPDIFVDTDDDEISRRGTWYYDGLSLSEFKQEQLSLAYRRGLRGYFGPTCEYCESFINSSNPANIVWNEGQAFRHYLFEIRRQWLDVMKVEKSKRIDYIINLFNKASNHIDSLSEKGFSLGHRGFNNEIIDACTGALKAIKVDRKLDIGQL